MLYDSFLFLYYYIGGLIMKKIFTIGLLFSLSFHGFLFSNSKKEDLDYGHDYYLTKAFDSDLNQFIKSEGWIGTVEEPVIRRYEELIDNVTLEEKQKVENAILDSKIAAYRLYVENLGIANKISGIRSPSDDPVVVSAIEYLNNEGCYLTVELINHFLAQSTPPQQGSYYVPVYGWVTNYTFAASSIIQSSTVSGGSIFESTVSTYEKDSFYAIHKFDYDKKDSNSKGFVLTDTYDFALIIANQYGYNLAVVLANNVMWYYQVNGDCYPYDIKIKCAPISSSISVDTFTELNQYNYLIDHDIYVGFQLTVYGIYQGMMLMTGGIANTSIEIYNNSNHYLIGAYSGNGYSMNTLCKPSLSQGITYYVLVKSYSNGLTSGTLSVFKNGLNANQVFNTNIINSPGDYYGITYSSLVNSFVIDMSYSGTYRFYIGNGYEEYGYGFYLIDPILNTVVENEWEYYPTYSVLTANLSSAFDYLLLVYFEDFADGGWNFTLSVSNV